MAVLSLRLRFGFLFYFGIVIVAVVPWFGFLVSLIVHLFSSSRRFACDSPMPRLRPAGLPEKNGSDALARVSASMPQPLSTIWIVTESSCCGQSAVTVIGPLPSGYESSAFEMGEMRKAITGSFITVYFVVVALLIFKGVDTVDTELSKTIIGHFTYLVGIIIVFYFGSRGVREYLKYRNLSKKSDE